VDATALHVRFISNEGREVESSLDEADPTEIARSAPVRTPPSYAGQSHYPGLFWSATTESLVVYESRLELGWLWLADFDPSVVRIAAQPFELRGGDGGRVRVRYPDFLWVGSDGRIGVVDVKPASMLADHKVQAALAWTAEALRSRGWSYEVWHGAPPTVLRNVRLIAVGRRPGVVKDEVITGAVAACPPAGTTLEALERRVRGLSVAAPARTVIFAALWQGRLVCRIDSPIDGQTWVMHS